MKLTSFNALAPILPEYWSVIKPDAPRSTRRRWQRAKVKIAKWRSAGVRSEIAPWQRAIKNLKVGK